MLQKSHMTQKERKNWFSNLIIITCMFPLSRAAPLLFQGESVGRDSVTQTERSAQQEKKNGISLFTWLVYSLGQKTKEKIIF